MRAVRFGLPILVLLAVVFVASFFPQDVSAGDPLSGALVPTCHSSENGGFIGACQLCDLVKLARNIINFSIAFSVIAATLLFAYAGFMYFTAASSPDNIKKAHGIFTKTLTGIVIILAAWLLVNILMVTVSGGAFSLSDDINCEEYPTSAALPLGSGITAGGQSSSAGGRGGGLPYDRAAEDDMRARLQTAGIGINNTDRCETPQRSGCTNVGGLHADVVRGLINLKARCNCSVIVTGGTEQGAHASHTGRQVDIRFTTDLSTPFRTAILGHQEELGIRRICAAPGSAFRYNCTVNEDPGHLHLEF